MYGDPCNVCGFPANWIPGADVSGVHCHRCGSYYITSIADAILKTKDPKSEENLALSSLIFESQGLKVTTENLEGLRSLRRPNIMQRAERLLRYLASRYPSAGENIFISWATMRPTLDGLASGKGGDAGLAHAFLPMMAASWSHFPSEVGYLAASVLTDELGWLHSDSGGNFKISPKGWVFLQSSHQATNPKLGFIAMSFNSDLLRFSTDVVAPAIEGAGYEPLRIDNKEHTNRIDDELIATIRSARFVVIDFTEHKQNVYFEAGLAIGFGVPVIWMCRREDMKNRHFDTRQFNTIDWEWDDLPDARRRLENRIRATIGPNQGSQVHD